MLSPSSRRRHFCIGVISLVTPALPPALCRRRHRCCAVLFSSYWHCCQHRAGIFTSVPQTLTPLLRWRLRHCFAGVVAIVALASSPLLHPRVASIVRASLQAFHWRCCPHRTRVATTIMQASSHAFRWCRHPRCAGSKPSFFWRCRRHRVVAVGALVLLPSSHPRFASIALASLLLLSSHCWAGVFTIV